MRMKYEKPEMMLVMIDDEDVIRTSLSLEGEGGGIKDPDDIIEFKIP